MKATLELMLGNKKFKIEGGSDGATSKDIIKGMSFWTQMPVKCSLCGKSDISLNVRTAKNQKGQDCEFYEVKCNDCKAALAIHQKADRVGLYIVEDEAWTIYNGGKGNNAGAKNDHNDDESSNGVRDTPF